MKTHCKVSLVAVASVLALAACDEGGSTSGPGAPAVPKSVTIRTTSSNATTATAPAVPGSPVLAEIAPEAVTVCKYGTDASFDYTWTDKADRGNTGGDRFSLLDGDCVVVLEADEDGADVTVTEDLSALPNGGQLDRVVVSVRTDDAFSSTTSSDPVAQGMPRGGQPTVGVLMEFFNSIVPGGGEGCTPGYWKQSQHFDSWTNHLPDDPFDNVFDPDDQDLRRPERGSTADITLLQALGLRGGGVNELIRHTVAALLNAASGDVSYDLNESDVTSRYTAAIGGDVEGQKEEFAAFNEQGCPLN